MLLTDPFFLVTFFGGLAVAFFVARGIRKLIDRRRARKVVLGPDTRSRQVKRAQQREAKKRENW